MKKTTVNQMLKTGGVALLSMVGVLQSCNKEQHLDAAQNAAQLTNLQVGGVDSFFVDQNFAERIARRLPSNYFEQESETYLTENFRELANVYPLSFQDGDNPLAYLINYANNGGYVIISADIRYEPILAWGKSGNINSTDSLPSMFVEWAGYNLENIEQVKVGTYHDMESVIGFAQKWYNYYSTMGLGEDIPTNPNMNFEKPTLWPPDDFPQFPEPCPHTSITKGPFLNTYWHQYQGYNDALAYAGCSSTGNGKYPTGSVPIAIGQLLKYWSKPNATYNYSQMDANEGKTASTQTLLKDIAQLGLVNSTYSCSGTTGNSDFVPIVFVAFFNYSNGISSHQDYNFQGVVPEINANRVVYLSGISESTTGGIWFWKNTSYGNREAWLCDGYRMVGSYCHPTKYLSMNWGWGDYWNNWVFEDKWVDRTSRNWQYKRKMITNIKP